jgi:phage anti-repressor protein
MTTTDQKIMTELEALKGVLIFNASELHKILKIEKPFKKWISRKIQQWGYVEDVDFKKVKMTKRVDGTVGKMTEYYVSISMAAEMSISEKSELGIEAAITFRRIMNGLRHPFSNKDFREDFNEMINKWNETLKICPF